MSLRIARFVLERIANEGSDKDDETQLEKMYASLITETIQSSLQELALQDDKEFQQYYELICARMLLLPHGLQQIRTRGLSIHQIVTCSRFAEFFRLMDDSLRERYDQQKNAFHPARIRLVHRQYLQLDRDGNGMLSVSELQDYGKKRAFNPAGNEPTHDLTDAFVTQVFAEVPTFYGEMDYHAYLDFTLTLSDKVSAAALRVSSRLRCVVAIILRLNMIWLPQFFWGVLDFQKQGFLDAFTLDYFLRSLLEKIYEHEGKDDAPTVDRLRVCASFIFNILERGAYKCMCRPRFLMRWLQCIQPELRGRISSVASWVTALFGELEKNVYSQHSHLLLRYVHFRFITDYVAYRIFEDSGRL
ncbi:unnamed protein product [Phytophthora lilii]|uniref:Unnamed protein product n=1 Tax=Phytophthora lilii TaxID=2077276 RepID=A0A9W6U4L9_9STRA|nr:unnamed protein product [Phytophthora lilii]